MSLSRVMTQSDLQCRPDVNAKNGLEMSKSKDRKIILKALELNPGNTMMF